MTALLKKNRWMWVLARQGRQLAMQTVRKAPLCGRVECMTRQQHSQAVQELVTFRAQPLKIGSDGILTHWRTEYGDWWSPPARFEFIEKMVHEIRMNAYGLMKDCSDAVVLDGGANIGMFARYALEAGASRVVCFEPSPATRLALARNLAPYIEQDRVTVVSKALWNEKGRALFALAEGDAGSNQVVQSDGVRGAETGIDVELSTIDLEVADLGLSRVDFIKLDIEGAESAAIKGAALTLSRFRPTVAVATEHTIDVLANNVAVLDAFATVAPQYRTKCMECHAEHSASFGGVALTPYLLQMSAGPA
jgi:FkbM family methyltransferase